jgi:hypothetical protein
MIFTNWLRRQASPSNGRYLIPLAVLGPAAPVPAPGGGGLTFVYSTNSTLPVSSPGMYFVVGRYAVQPLSAADVALSCGITGGSILSTNGSAAFSIIRTVAGVVTPGTVSGIVVVPPDSVELRNDCISESAASFAVTALEMWATPVAVTP